MRLKILLISLFACSCASTPNVPLCISLSPSECYCTWTAEDKHLIVNDDTTLDGQTCVDLRSKSILMPTNSWTKIKAFIIKVCHQNNQCTGVSDWESKIDLLDGK